MKYDCSKIPDYVHERNRMCAADKNRDCSNCPLKGVGVSCYHVRFITQKHIDIVQKWSDEHPEKTRYQAFLEIFPKFYKYSTPNHIPCFYLLVGKRMCKLSSVEICAECWQEPYNGEFEKAREEDE